jgi:trigger factor
MNQQIKQEKKRESRLETISQCKREIEVEIPQDEVEKEFNKVLTQYAARAKVHGFRPGKVPKDIVKRMFYPDIKNSLLDSIIRNALGEELGALKVYPINAPVIRDIHFKEGEPLRFKASFEIWPDFELPDYKKIKVKKKEVSVKEKEVEQSLKQLQERVAEYIPVEGRGVGDGDYVLVEIKGIELKSKKFLPTEKAHILAGHPENEKLLNENLRGLKNNEERTFVLTYDKNHKNKKLAGENVEYNVKVISIKEKKLPKIDDDFAKGLGEYENLEDLKKKIKEEIFASKENIAQREIAEEIVERMSEKLKIELPETLVEAENISLIKRRLAQLPPQELKKENIEALRAEGKVQAEKSLKSHLILRKIAETEGFEVSEEEKDQELRAIAEANNIPLAKVIDNFNREGRREELKDSILLKKTVDFLVKQAIID